MGSQTATELLILLEACGKRSLCQERKRHEERTDQKICDHQERGPGELCGFLSVQPDIQKKLMPSTIARRKERDTLPRWRVGCSVTPEALASSSRARVSFVGLRPSVGK
jgi:hypothetical protein